MSLSAHHPGGNHRGGYQHHSDRGGRNYGNVNHHPHYAKAAVQEPVRNSVYDNLVTAVVRTVFELTPSAHSRLRTDFNRQDSSATEPIAKDWSLRCGSLNTTGAVVRVNYNNPSSPGFFADPRADFLTFTLPKPRMFVSPLPSDLHASCSFVANSCSSCTGRVKHHRIGSGGPRLFVIGDEYTPVTIGENGDCCPVIRVKGGSFDNIKSILDLQIQLGLVIPPRSVAVIFLTSHLLKVGQEKFWHELNTFTDWAGKTNLTILPGLQPYPTMSQANLNILRQFYCRLQLLHHGDITKPRFVKYALWEPFAATANTPNMATVAPVEMSIFHLQDSDTNINTPVSAEGDFVTGFGSDWTKGMPTDIEKVFFTNLFTTIRSVVTATDVAASNLRIPADTAVEEGIHQAPDADFLHLAGRKIHCMGTSLIALAKKQLMKQARLYKVEVTEMCRPGKFLKFVLDQDMDKYLAPLKRSKSDDVIYMSFIGNEILKKSGHEKDKTTHKFHIKDPSILSGEDFNILVADVMHVVSAVKKRFHGSIFIIGPMPRHLEPCCDEKSHKITDEIGIEVDMTKYVNVINDQLRRQLPLPADCYFIDYRQIFGDSFGKHSLEDGVHLEEGHSKKFAHALLKGYDVLLPAPPAPADKDATLAESLHAVEIIARESTAAAGEKEKERTEEYEWDNLDYD